SHPSVACSCPRKCRRSCRPVVPRRAHCSCVASAGTRLVALGPRWKRGSWRRTVVVFRSCSLLTSFLALLGFRLHGRKQLLLAVQVLLNGVGNLAYQGPPRPCYERL